MLLAVKNMGGESEAAWRAILDDLIARGLRTPAFVIVDGAPGLEKALSALWPDLPAQRCTVGLLRNPVRARLVGPGLAVRWDWRRRIRLVERQRG